MIDEITELDAVALLRDLPQFGLRAGQIGTVVFRHEKGKAFEVEFMLTPRKSVVATVERDQLLKLHGVGAAPAAPG